MQPLAILRRSRVFDQGTAAFDRVNSILGSLVTDFHCSWGPVFGATYLEDESARKAMIAKALPKVAGGYARIEGMLTNRPWLFGDAPTIADAYLYGIARWGHDLESFDIAREWAKTPPLSSPMPSRTNGPPPRRAAFSGT